MEKSRINQVVEYHANGYNCCQSIVCTYCDLVEIGMRDAFRISEGLGSGVGVYAICGAVSAMALLVGLKTSDGNLTAPATKKLTYELDQKLIALFLQKNASIDCMDLKGVKEGSVPLRSCNGCMVDCAQIIETRLFPGQFELYSGEQY